MSPVQVTGLVLTVLAVYVFAWCLCRVARDAERHPSQWLKAMPIETAEEREQREYNERFARMLPIYSSQYEAECKVFAQQLVDLKLKMEKK